MSTARFVPQDMYRYLPLIYEEAGLSEFAGTYTYKFIQFLQEQGWIGRRVLDLGCATGASTEAFAQRQMSVMGVDGSATMIARAQQRFADGQYDVHLENIALQDYRPVKHSQDLVYCFDALNRVTNVREVEGVFQRANWTLQDGKQFLFDLQTIRYLASKDNIVEIISDQNNVMIIARHTFDFDTSSLRRHLTLFFPHEGQLQRREEVHVLRAYPQQAIVNLLSRAGFKVLHTVDLDLQPYDEARDRHGRIVFVVEKTQDFTQQG